MGIGAEDCDSLLAISDVVALSFLRRGGKIQLTIFSEVLSYTPVASCSPKAFRISGSAMSLWAFVTSALSTPAGMAAAGT